MNGYECIAVCSIIAGQVLLCLCLLAKALYEDHMEHKLKMLENQKENER